MQNVLFYMTFGVQNTLLLIKELKIPQSNANFATISF